ncbi:hypothetical protein QR680_013935 [Steinernema hermaphroditum]|uniref:G-protein coupled receptors family 1 profile domain-containing protein n=1 Tax=Steinernema hermaphroditum TaxID=289476 RepID=A0AA39I9S4_9BILA|nr:hypothetical protein QR680_013935 [Steinernema hermaphroditum]
MAPPVAYFSYSVRLICSLITLILNPITLYNGSKCNLKYAQTSMVLCHLCVKIILAFCTLVYCICVFVEDAEFDQHALFVFWATLFHQALLLVATFSDLFLTIDRLIAISYPLSYARVKKKLVLIAVLTCSIVFAGSATVFVTNMTEKAGRSLIWMESINTTAAVAIFAFTAAAMLPLTCINVLFLYKLRRYNKRVGFQSSVDQLSKLVNNVVFQQVILSIVVWIIPAFIRLFIEYGLNITINSAIQADPSVTLIMVYMALCSIIYWRKLVSNNVSNVEVSSR